MLPGPIFNMELLTSARRARYFFIRAIYATVLLIGLGLVYQSWAFRMYSETADIRAMAQLSAVFFGVLAMLQLSAVVLLGPAMVAGTIATERERRTIEYLFASGMSNAEIVLGKLAARIVHVVYLVLTGVPILALMMLLGGIAPEGVLALTIVTLCTVLSISTLSIAISVWSAKAREAVTRTYMLLFALLVLPWVVMITLRTAPFYGFISPVNDQLLAANPFAMLAAVISQASDAMRGPAFDLLVVFVRNHLILSVLLATAATWGVRRVHLKHTTKEARRRWRLSHLFRPAVGNQPMLWKEVFAEPAAARLGWVGRIAGTLIVLAVTIPTLYVFYYSVTRGNSYWRAGREYLQYAVTLGTFLACGGLLLVAARAAGSVTSEKERDCWTSLLSTPLEPSEIIWAKTAGSVWSLRGAVLLLLLIWGLGVLLDPSFLIAIPFMLGMLMLLAFYVAALGIRYSLACRTSLRAMGATLATATFIGGFYLCCCVPVFATSHAGEEMMVTFAPCIPFLLAIPGVAGVEGDNFFRGREAGPMMIAFIAGTVGYLIAAIALTGSSIASFERLAGRTRRRTATSMSHALSAQSSPEPRRELPKEPVVESASEAILLPPSTPDIL